MAESQVTGTWKGWYNALADPKRHLSITIIGHLRSQAWEQGPRRLDEHMLHYIIAGGQRGQVAGSPIATQASSLLWIPPGTSQTLHKSARPKVFSKYFLRFQLPGVEAPRGQPWVCRNVPGAHPVFGQLYSEYHSNLPAREPRLRALLVMLFSEWQRALAPSAPVLDQQQRAQLLAMVDRYPAQRLTADELARALEMTPTWFSRVFKNTFGRAPRSWLVCHRIEKAAERLLDEHQTIAEVAEEYGYADLFLFSRQFRQVMGKSPRAFRADRRLKESSHLPL